MEIKATAYNSNNEIIKCNKCEKESGYIIQGVDFQIALCDDHSPYANQPKATLVYRPIDPKDLSQEDKNKISTILDNMWTIDLRNKE